MSDNNTSNGKDSGQLHNQELFRLARKIFAENLKDARKGEPDDKKVYRLPEIGREFDKAIASAALTVVDAYEKNQKASQSPLEASLLSLRQTVRNFLMRAGIQTDSKASEKDLEQELRKVRPVK